MLALLEPSLGSAGNAYYLTGAALRELERQQLGLQIGELWFSTTAIVPPWRWSADL